MSSLRFLAVHLGALFAVAATAYVAGSFALRTLLGSEERKAVGRFSLASTLGLVVLATIGALLGVLGLLARTPLLVAAATIHFAGWTIWRDVLATIRTSPRPRWLLAGFGFAVATIPFVALSIYPPTAFDETLYHLPFARAFAETGGLPFLPGLRFPVFPQLGEVLAAEVLLFAGDTATHFVSLFAVALTAALLWTWGGEWEGSESGATRLAGWLAAAIWLGNPLVVYLSGTGYVEPLLALFVTAGCYSFWTWRRAGSPAWLVLSAIFVGSAAGTKYLGLFFVAALALATLWPDRRSAQRPAHTLRNVVLFAGVSVIAMAPWYGRILAFTGNPVFPYLSGIFGANDWTPVRFRTLPGPWNPTDWFAGLASGAGKLATLPWDVVARRHLVGHLPPISPVYLVGVPLLVFGGMGCMGGMGGMGGMAGMEGKRDRTLRAWLLLAAGFVCLFPLLPADARYLVTVLPLFSWGLGVVLTSLSRRWMQSRRSVVIASLAGLAIALAFPGWLYALHRISLQGFPPMDSVAREAYLSRALPLYPAVARVNQLVRPGDVVYGLHVESMHYFVRGRFLGDFYGPHRFALLPDRQSEPAAFLATLESWGVDYLVVSRAAAGGPAAPAVPGLTQLFEDSAAVIYAVRSPMEVR